MPAETSTPASRGHSGLWGRWRLTCRAQAEQSLAGQGGSPKRQKPHTCHLLHKPQRCQLAKETPRVQVSYPRAGPGEVKWDQRGQSPLRAEKSRSVLHPAGVPPSSTQSQERQPRRQLFIQVTARQARTPGRLSRKPSSYYATCPFLPALLWQVLLCTAARLIAVSAQPGAGSLPCASPGPGAQLAGAGLCAAASGAARLTPTRHAEVAEEAPNVNRKGTDWRVVGSPSAAVNKTEATLLVGACLQLALPISWGENLLGEISK